MNRDKIKQLFETSKDKRGDARKMGLTAEGIRNIIDGADARVSTIEAIAKFYNVPVGYFFDEAEADGRKTYEVEIANLKGQVQGLKDAIKILKAGRM
jgi:transcriptional regulator with XRE-family HTH domain